MSPTQQIEVPPQPTAAPPVPEISVVQVAPRQTAVVRDVVGVTGLPAFFARALPQVATALVAPGAHMAGPPVAHYRGATATAVDVEVGYPVLGRAPAVGAVTPGSLPGGRAVTTVHVGPYAELGATYEKLAAWMGEHGLTPGADMWEEYLIGPDAEADPAHWVTRVWWLVD